MAIRTGRFRHSDSSNLTIVKGGPAAIYRIFNSGSESFNVVTTIGAGSGSQSFDEPLLPQNSLDIEPGAEVQIKRTGTTPAEGIYDVTGKKEGTVRNGRFIGNIKATGTAAETEIVIGSIKTPTLYRVLNAAAMPLPTETNPIPPIGITFKVEIDGLASHDIPPKQSFDFVAKDEIKIKTSSAQLVQIEGIYEQLDPDASIRSGRFTRREGHSPDSKYKLVSTRDLPKALSIYRVFNSGEYDFKLYEKNTELGIVSPGNSLDVKVSKNKDLMVEALDNNTIEGIYEFLGGE